MKRVVVGPAVLYLADCRDVLPKLGKVDAVVTDPPYGINYCHGGGGRGKHPRRIREPIIGDKKPFDPTPWLQWPCVLWGANHYSNRLPHGRWLAWNKLGTLEPWDDFCDVEFAFQNCRRADRIFSLLWKGIIQGEKVNGGKRYHPTQKPIALMRWCVEQLPRPSKLILDPFMGSGTTGVAAIQLGRKFIGIEKDPKYFKIALKRIREAWKAAQ